jgi:Family of unknown function (DUF6295)
MCTDINVRTAIAGSAKGPQTWMRVDTANVSYDHPCHAPFDYCLNIDLTNESAGGQDRVALELSAEAARALVAAIERALAKGEAQHV